METGNIITPRAGRWLAGWTCVSFMLLSLSVVASEQQVVRLFSNDSYNLNLNMWLLVDDSNSLTIDDITTQKYQARFKKNRQNILNLGVSDATYWMRVKLFYPSAYPNKDNDQQWLLEIANPSLDIAEMFIAEYDGVYKVKSSDTRSEYSDRDVLHVNSVFSLRLLLGQEITIYLKVKNTTSMYIPLTLWTTAGFAEKVAFEEFSFGIFFGGMLILLIYNLFIYVSIRDVSYLFYVIYLGGITTFEMMEVGRGVIHLDRYVGDIDREYIIYFIWITAISIIYFAKNFVSIRENNKKINNVLNVFLMIAFFSILLISGIDYSSAILWNAMYMSIFLPAFSGVLVYCWIKGNENAKYLFFAWISNAIGLSIFAGLTYKVIPATQFTLVVTLIGIYIEALVLSFALAYRIKREQIAALVADSQAMGHLVNYQSAFDNAMEGMYKMTLGGRVVNVNPAMVDIFGFKNEKELFLCGKTISISIFENIEKQFEELSKCGISTNNIAFKRKDGKRVWAIHRSKLIVKSTGVISHIEGSIVDVTQTKLKNIAIEEQAKEGKKLEIAEESAKAKSEFLSNMSHEIRTPLTAVIGFSESLQDFDLSKVEREEAVRLISDSSRSLLQLINNILDYSKLEANKLSIENVPVSVFSVVEGVKEDVSKNAQRKGLTLDFYYEYPIPEEVFGDPFRIAQIIENLCSNAIKFSEKGCVTLCVSWNKTLDKLIIRVSDRGLGISEEAKKNLFGLFGLGDTSPTRQFGGAGLGLAISKKLAMIMGGDIEVLSEFGKGSEFTFIVGGCIPDNTELIRDKNTLMTSKYKRKSTPPSLTGTVLLAEDNIVNQKLIEKVLRKTGVDVVVVENGLEACSICDNTPPDFVLMDVNMPIRGGLEATRYLRGKGYAMPIYALTAETDKQQINNVLEAGCEGVLYKPVDKSAIFDVLRKHLSGNANQARPVPEAVSVLGSVIEGSNKDGF